MNEYKIKLNSIDLVKSFISAINKYDIQANLCYGRYSIDATSILGIFTLNLTKILNLQVHSIRPESDIENFEKDIEPFLAIA